MVKREKTYIIIVNFKGFNDTIECLESVLKSTFTPYQIIVIDNSPTTESISKLESWAKGESGNIISEFPDLVFPLESKPLSYISVDEDQFNEGVFAEKVIFVSAKENRGFSAANNIGIRYALKQNDFSFIWLLNNDTVVEKDSLWQLVNHASQSSREGIIGCVLYYYYQKNTIQGIGGYYNPWFGIVREFGKNQEQVCNKSKLELDYVIGASMLLKRELLEEIGLLNEEYFLYFEELDLAIRAKLKRWKLGFCENCIVHHKGGVSITAVNNSEMADFYYARNRILITQRFFPYAYGTLVLAFSKFIYNRIKKRQFSRIKMLMSIILKPLRHYNEWKKTV